MLGRVADIAVVINCGFGPLLLPVSAILDLAKNI